MNMQFLPGSTNSTPVLDEDDPVRKKITFFSRRIVGIVYKCSIQEKSNTSDVEFGFYPGHIEVEGAVESAQLYVCETFIKLLEGCNNPDTIIQEALHTYQ